MPWPVLTNRRDKEIHTHQTPFPKGKEGKERLRMLTKKQQIMTCIKTGGCISGMAAVLGVFVFLFSAFLFAPDPAEVLWTLKNVSILLVLIFLGASILCYLLVKSIIQELTVLQKDMHWSDASLCTWFLTHEDQDLAPFFFQKSVIQKGKEQL